MIQILAQCTKIKQACYWSFPPIKAGRLDYDIIAFACLALEDACSCSLLIISNSLRSRCKGTAAGDRTAVDWKVGGPKVLVGHFGWRASGLSTGGEGFLPFIAGYRKAEGKMTSNLINTSSWILHRDFLIFSVSSIYFLVAPTHGHLVFLHIILLANPWAPTRFDVFEMDYSICIQ